EVGRKPTKVREQRPQQGAALSTPKNRPDEAANVLELRQLQRLAGNQAVTHFIVQREAALEPLTEAKGAPLPTPVGPSAALAKEVENKAFKAVVKAMSEERLAKAFESAVKVGSNVMKSNYAALSGEKEANAFLTGLEVRFQAGIQAIEGHLTNMSDLELIATA